MLVDYHMHTPLCKHATGTPEQYAAQAVSLGLKEIGFSDHNPMPPWYDPDFRMTFEQFSEYEEIVRTVRVRFRDRLRIRFGIEADYFPGTEQFVRDLCRRTEFDYVIGSVHYLGNWGFDNPANVEEFARRDLDEVYAEYFSLIEQMADSRMFDIVGHFDLVKKFGHRPSGKVRPLARRALEAIADVRMCIEINTSGLRKPVKEPYPSADLLRLAAEVGVPVTLGSDAHDPHDVGADFDVAVRMLREAGYSSLVRFEARKPIPESI